MTKIEPLDKATIVFNITGHPFKIGEEVKVFRVFSNNTYDVCNKNGDCWRVKKSEIDKINNSMKQMTDAVINTARKLCMAQNQVTTLEIKAEVIKSHPQYFWTQNFVSATMDTLYQRGDFVYTDINIINPKHKGEIYRVYSYPSSVILKSKTVKKTATKTAKATTNSATVVKAPKTKTIGRQKALELMQNNKGHFFTVIFVDKSSKDRTMNCQYLKDQKVSTLGYVKVKEAIKAKIAKNTPVKKNTPKVSTIRTINLQTLKQLRIAGNSYKIK